MIEATGNEVEPYWPMLFGKFLNGKVEELITAVGGGGGAAAPAAAAAAEEAPKEDGKKKVRGTGVLGVWGCGDSGRGWGVRGRKGCCPFYKFV